MPPDRDFVIGPLPGHEEVVVAVGAGHGFKFASVFGDILSEFTIAGATEHKVRCLQAGPTGADRSGFRAALPERIRCRSVEKEGSWPMG